MFSFFIKKVSKYIIFLIKQLNYQIFFKLIFQALGDCSLFGIFWFLLLACAKCQMCCNWDWFFRVNVLKFRFMDLFLCSGKICPLLFITTKLRGRRIHAVTASRLRGCGPPRDHALHRRAAAGPRRCTRGSAGTGP